MEPRFLEGSQELELGSRGAYEVQVWHRLGCSVCGAVMGPELLNATEGLQGFIVGWMRSGV